MKLPATYLKEIYKILCIKSPAVANLILRFHYGHMFNRVTKKISGKNNKIKYKYSILSHIKIDINGNDNSIEIYPECYINRLSITIKGHNHKVKIGKGCKINQGGSFRLVGIGGHIEIGNKTTIESAHIAVTEQDSKVIIGNDCMFASDIDIRTGDSHAIFDSTTKKRLNFAKDVLIGQHVWIAPHTIILKGVKLPDNSIVATGSVVVKGFGEEDGGIIIAGNPAKIVKAGITWSRDR